jgi:hypothetical protein
MNKQKLYVTTLGVTFFTSLITLQFIISNVTIETYLNILIICYFGVTSVFKPKMRAPDLVGGALLVTFSYLVLMKVISLLNQV